MLTTVDIIYFIILATSSYFVFLHLILWFEVRGIKEKFKKMKELPSVSILIPAYNEERIIKTTLEKITQINYPKNKLEIIVIDDGSKDKTHEIAKKLESRNLKVLTKKNGGKASALNFGLKHAKNDFIAVIDADTFLEKNALLNCMKYFNEENVAAVTSHILVKHKKNIWEKLQNIELMIIAFMRKAQEQLNVVFATPGPLSVYNRDILLKIGKFDEKNLVEDVEIAWRLLKNGYRIRMAFDAFVYSIYPDNFKTWLKQRLRWGIGGIQTLQKYFSSMFDKKSHMVGEFLVPTSIISYSFTILGIGLFFYLLLIALITNIIYIAKLLTIGINPFNAFEIIFAIDLKFVYGLIMFVLSLVILKIALGTHKEKPNIINLLLFLTVYPILLPSVTLYSVYKFIRKERGWLTK